MQKTTTEGLYVESTMYTLSVSSPVLVLQVIPASLFDVVLLKQRALFQDST